MGIRVTSTLKPRTATYVVAAFDAPAHVKAQADYVCDGTDDQVEIQAAIDALPHITPIVEIGKIVLAGGSFIISAKIIVRGFMIIEGLGLGTVLTLATGANSTMIEFDGRFALQDVWLNGNKVNQTVANPLLHGLSNTENFFLQRSVILSSKGEAIKLEGGHILVVNQCQIEYNDGAAIYVTKDAVGIDVQSSMLHHNLITIKMDIVGRTTPWEPAGSIIANNNYLSAGTQHSIWINGHYDLTVTGNLHLAGGAGYDGIYLENNVHSVYIAGNQFATDERYAVNIADSTVDRITVENNQLRGTAIPLYNVAPGANKHGIVRNNIGYLDSSEIRTYQGSLATVAQNGAVIAWQNPEAQAMLATCIVRVTTAAGAAADGRMGVNVTTLVVEDCEDAWNESAGAHVVSTLNTTDFERGSGSASIAFTTGVVNDEMATEVIAKDLTTYTHVTLKIKPSVAVAAGDLQLLLDEHGSCVSPLETLVLPALTAGVWTLLCLPLATPAGDGAIISIGLQYHLNAAVNTILVDDVRGITVGTALFNGAGGCDLNTPAVYDSMNIADAGASGKPVYIDAKNGTNDLLIMISDTAASTNLVGSYYLKGVGV